MHALGLTAAVDKSFSLMSQLTGGQFFRAGQGNAAIKKLKEILDKEFGQLDFDRDVFSAWSDVETPTVDDVADVLKSTPPRVASAVCRLQSRGLLVA